MSEVRQHVRGHHGEQGGFGKKPEKAARATEEQFRGGKAVGNHGPDHPGSPVFGTHRRGW